MEFHSMCVGEEIFGPESFDGAFDMGRLQNCLKGQSGFMAVQLTIESSNQTEELLIESERDLLTEFMTAMSLTHNCIAVDKNDKIVYQG